MSSPPFIPRACADAVEWEHRSKVAVNRLFVSELEHSRRRWPSSGRCWRSAQSLAIPVLAEGIETEHQLQVLNREGCNEVQGFLLGYPAAPPLAHPPQETAARKALSA